MKIGISLLSAKSRRSDENYLCNLITELSKIESDDEYVVFADLRRLPWLSSISGNIRVINVRLPSSWAPWVWEHLFFLTSQQPQKVDVVHFPIGGGVVGYRGTFVLTIHDLIRYSHKEFVSLPRHLMWRLWCKANLGRAARIIVVSEHVKRDIMHQFPVPSEHIQVVYLSASKRFEWCASTPEFKDKYRLPDHYVLVVAATSPNKNIRRAIDAVTLAREQYSLDHQLIVAGMRGADDAALKAYVNSNKLQHVVRFLGYVDDTDLPQLYANAELFLWPSIMEGFGLPPLEAMRCGIPVVASNTSCIPEILGDAPIWVNPMSVESIAQGMATALLDKTARDNAIARGTLRAKQFSWEKMASDTARVYREAAHC
jgi:glycosyltransferase involved in cell wall biosynthesis